MGFVVITDPSVVTEKSMSTSNAGIIAGVVVGASLIVMALAAFLACRYTHNVFLHTMN